MKGADTKLKWMQRVWIFGLTPFLAWVFWSLSVDSGMGIVATYFGEWAVLFVPTLPIGIIIFAASVFLEGKVPYSVFALALPLSGYFQWFVIVPYLFERWRPEKIVRFWKIWILSVVLVAFAMIIFLRENELVELFIYSIGRKLGISL